MTMQETAVFMQLRALQALAAPQHTGALAATADTRPMEPRLATAATLEPTHSPMPSQAMEATAAMAPTHTGLEVSMVLVSRNPMLICLH